MELAVFILFIIAMGNASELHARMSDIIRTGVLLDKQSVKEMFSDFEESIQNSTTSIKLMMANLNKEGHSFMNGLQKYDSYLLWKELMTEKRCSHISFSMSELSASFKFELMTLMEPIKEILNEVDDVLLETRADVRATLAAVEAISAICRLKSENCTEKTNVILVATVSRNMCRLTGVCEEDIPPVKKHVIGKRQTDPMYICPSGNKIPRRYVCDGSPDCKDGADETNCENACNYEFEWQCKNEKCIWRFRYCDGKDDCGDGSDEEDCHGDTETPTPRKLLGAFQCDNGNIVSENSICDGLNDCGDGSDEENCHGDTETLTPRKLHGAFQCDNGNIVTENSICDGLNDCGDGSDEENCHGDTETPTPRKLHGAFQCDNGNIVTENSICDGLNDCGDGSDEENCHGDTETPTPRKLHGAFQCDNGNIVTENSICDGSDDCGDASDEKCQFQKNVTNKEPISCEDNQYKCLNGADCIDEARLCNGHNDCSDGSDEAACTQGPTLGTEDCNFEQDKFSCNDSSTCIDILKVCDGVQDCIDGSDESCSNVGECTPHCQNIGGLCFRHPSGSLCLRHCPSGYTTIEGTCKRTVPNQVSPASLQDILERARVMTTHLLTEIRLLKFQTRQNLSKLSKQLSSCLIRTKYYRNILFI